MPKYLPLFILLLFGSCSDIEQEMTYDKNILKSFISYNDYTSSNFSKAEYYALVEIPDSSFKYLYRIEKKEFNHIFKNTNFISICEDKRWISLRNEIVKTQNIKPKDGLLAQWKMNENSYGRLVHKAKISGLSQKKKKKWADHFWELNKQRRSKNEEILNQLIILAGGEDKFDEGHIFFNTVQHSGDTTFMNGYKPLFEKLIKKEILTRKQFAYYTDKLNMLSGVKQIYGTQTIYDKTGRRSYYPIENVEIIDSLRKDVGFRYDHKKYLQVLNRRFE